MRNSRWLRVGLTTIVLGCGASAAFLVACGDDDVTPDAGTDSGGGTDTGTTDTGTTDSGGDTGTDSGPKPANAKLVVVNGATDFGPNADIVAPGGPQAIRVCFALAADVTSVLTANASPLPPQPDSPKPAAGPVGIYIGTGGIFKSFGLDLEPLAIRPIIMNAKTLAEKGIVKPGPGLPGPTCDEILKAGATIDGSTFTENVDYWKLDPIPPNTLKKGKSYGLVLTGCTDDAATAPAEKCGPGFTPSGNPGKGNLKAQVFELARPASVAATEVATQFVHASSSAAWFANGNNPGSAIIPIVAGFADSTAQPAVGFKVVPGKGDGGATALNEITDAKNITGVDFGPDAGHAFTANPVALPGIALTNIKQLSFPSGVPDGGDYGNGKAMTFFAVGDPTAPTTFGGQFNLRTFHFLAFPNDPPVETYVP
ncbi:MAG: hypothetical protein JST00_10840 [Deltaproteobacteria bacterium]|nr:hypothetical protein [Deltaproteobacteria bacterium]